MLDSDLALPYLRLLRGWNGRDAAAMAGCFADDGVMIGFDGSLADGAEAIRAHLTPIFAHHPTAAYVTLIRSARRLGEAGIVRADAGMVPPGRSDVNPEVSARQTAVLRATGKDWRIVLFQCTPAALHTDAAGRQALTDELNAAVRERGLLPDA